MKRVFSILLLAFCAQANAEISAYQGTAAFFPDEKSTHNLPEAIPCITRPAATGQPMLFCTWLTSTRYVDIWDAQRQQNVRITNKVNGMCQRGNCRIQGAEVGHWKENTPFQLSIWYRIGSSTDGKPVAYRTDASRQVSYVEAGSLLMRFYLDAGVPDNELVSTSAIPVAGLRGIKRKTGLHQRRGTPLPPPVQMARSQNRLVQSANG